MANRLRFTILGCGTSTGVPRIGGDWGDCDPNNPKNRRTRCSLLAEQFGTGDEPTRILIDTSADMREQVLRAGIGSVDGVLYSHGHADHTAGIAGLSRTPSVGMVWHPAQLGNDLSLDDLVVEFRSVGAPASVPRPGDSVRVGALDVAVLGPLRPYADPNDGSIVVEVRWGGTSVIMPGDIEAHAQHDLGPLRSDVLKVPHQGAATSDLTWIEASAPAIAVISVGPNDFGHPSDLVVETLETAGARVMRTDRDGSITIPFDQVSSMATGLPSAP